MVRIHSGVPFKPRRDGPFVETNLPDSFRSCAEPCAEIRLEYRLFLANLCLSVHREDLIPWCFEYTPGPPPITLLPLSWQSGTTIFATTPRHITADGDTSQRPLERVFLVGEDSLATATNTPPLKRPVGHVRTHGHVRFVTFYKDGTRKTVRLGTVAELPNEDEARRLADEVVIRTSATDRAARDTGRTSKLPA